MSEINDNYAVLNGILPYNIKFLNGMEQSGYNEESLLTDKKGKAYLDLKSGMWNISINPNILKDKIKSKVCESLDSNFFFSDIQSTENRIYFDLAEKLLYLLGHSFVNGRVVYGNSGTEANNIALKVGQAIKPGNIMSFKNSYHGSDGDAHSASGIDNDNELSENNIFIDFPDNLLATELILKNIENILIERKISSFIIEPVLASAGTQIAYSEFYNSLIDLLHQYGVLVIMDEVATGFFKTGSIFYFHQLLNAPDIVTVGKSITNGVMPLSGTIISANTWGKLLNAKITVEHFQTQNGNILGMEVASIVLDFFIKNKKLLLQNVKNIENTFLGEFSGNARCIGLMSSIILSNDYPLDFVYSLQNMGIIVYPFFNDRDVGITITPMITVDISKFKKAMILINRKMR